MTWYHWVPLALTIFYIPVLAIRGFRMGVLGMWVPKPCPPADPPGNWLVTCCEHNPCPDMPSARNTRARKYQTQPWRCPQCKSWWITKSRDYSGSSYQWHKVCEQVGDTFIMDLK